MKSCRPQKRFRFLGGLAIAALLLAAGFQLRRVAARNHPTPPHQPAATTSAVPATRTLDKVASPRPCAFAVASETATHQWAAADGRDTNIIRQLTHNDLEYARMVDENNRVQRRKLVYRDDPAAAVIQRAKLSGAPVTRLTLPGLDGQEIDFQITRADLNPSGQQGTFSGIVAGKLDSMVTLAFKGGREAFTVLSPSEKLFLQADPREPGEVIVKQIDPATYVPGVCGTP